MMSGTTKLHDDNRCLNDHLSRANDAGVIQGQTLVLASLQHSPFRSHTIFAVVGRHEGSGSLFAHLKAAGWAAALWAGESHLSFSTRSFFSVNVELTDEGA